MSVALIEPFDRWFLSLSKGSGTTRRNDCYTKFGGFDKLNHRNANLLDSLIIELLFLITLRNSVKSQSIVETIFLTFYGRKNMDAIWTKLYNAAKEVQNPRQISDYVSGGEVTAAILSKSGKIYTGVCIDTCSTLGICAERNAIFNMITNGENEFTKVAAVMPDGKCGAPCGACRELMVQLMPKTYKGIEILMDYENERIIKLGDITPEWWIGE